MKIAIKFDVEVPTEATDEQIDEWLKFALNVNGSCSTANPLIHKTVDPEFLSFEWEKINPIPKPAVRGE